jgi:hypothetical protein
MAATVSRIVLDAKGLPQMVIHPDKDSQLDDPAFSPAGTTQYDVPRSDYLGLTGPRDILAMVRPYVEMSGRATLAKVVQARVDLLDAISERDVAAGVLLDLIGKTGRNPTAAQKISIAALKARYDAAEANRQSVISNIQSLLATP